ncbi:nuclear transport factor 2 family protein [Brevibacterium sp.]|uniref:nuclear transport factor 2 family protein n=1 Tax=Brevibacterium sp. TaxID=1701 RepID=UPI0028124698|nr:nuclear transport factor 2 family protein [Brevibacterium sp.]
MNDSPLDTALAYHNAWTSADFSTAAELLSDDLEVDVPLNVYETKEDFVSALTSFGGAARGIGLLASLEGVDHDACLIYDMDVDDLGTLRVAEHLTIENGRISALRQIHDTAVLRHAGFGLPLGGEK